MENFPQDRVVCTDTGYPPHDIPLAYSPAHHRPPAARPRVGSTPGLSDKALDRTIARTPTKKLATMKDVAGATLFLLDNQSVNGINLYVDNGWLLT